MADPVVELHSGYIRGHIEKHEDGFDYYAFKGILYAEPPSGDLRFEDPIMKKKWTGTLDCKDYGPLCAQYDFVLRTFYYDENCLHLNVFTRAINESNGKKAVMVWSHFGNFGMGGANDMFFGPDYLIRKDIVLVTMNYRIGLLGFLDLQDPIAPGNQGLKDQITALQWIQRNIKVFGGDPGNVTFCGCAAGSISGHYLATSPLTKGLMHKIICQNGVTYHTWATVREPMKNAIKLCSLLGKHLTDPAEIKNFLKTVDITALMDACHRLWDIVSQKPFGPGIDCASPNPVVPIERCVTADKGTHLPCLVGHNKNDGLIFSLGTFCEQGNQDFGKLIHYNVDELLSLYDLSPSQVKRLYYKGESLTEDNMINYYNYCTDALFHLSVYRFIKVQAEKSSAPTYMYIFDYESPNKLGIQDYACKGVGLVEEFPFLFKCGYFDKMKKKHMAKGTKCYRVMEQMTEMWSNFAKYGRPTIERSELIPVNWKPISDGKLLRYMNIDEDLTMQYTVNLEEKWLSARQIVV